jgi:DNA-binding Lrp family transcriptional regulator
MAPRRQDGEKDSSMTKQKTENESLTDLDRAILNEIQSHFPIESRPYAVVGERVGASEAEVLERVAAMTEAGIIRRLGANFASRKLGYTSTLCAARVPPDKLEQFVAVVNHYPGVTHNYLRRHHFNVWFTLIAESAARLEEILGEIRRDSGASELLSLPAQEVFKIKVDFPV